jgi:exoribonuclease R
MKTLEEVRTLEEPLSPIPKALNLQPIASLGEKDPMELTPALGELYPYDTVETKRHDFGNLPVFVIDDVDAEELDDGISVEPVSTSPGKVWIHVHVADPTLLLPPDHVLARQAEIRFNTQYLLQDSYPMFPRELTDLVHLGSSKSQDGGQRALTFSALVNDSGDLEDVDIRASIIRNVQLINYDDVDASMGWGNFSPLRPFDDLPPLAKPSPDLIKWKDIFTILKDTLGRVVRKRNNHGHIMPNIPSPEVTAKNRPFPNKPATTGESLVFYGAPELDYVVNVIRAFDGARDMVAECMKLACRAASRWFIANGLPGVRRAMGPYESLNLDSIERLKQLQKEQGVVDIVELQKAGVIHPSSSNILEPRGHSALGVPDGEGYIRVTSPLRRYMDLVHHWQIKHILAGGSIRTLPFSQAALAERLPNWNNKERTIVRLDRKQNMYWAAKFIAERFSLPRNDPRAAPLRHLQARIFGEARWDPIYRQYNIPVLIDSLGLKAHIVQPTTVAPEIGTSIGVSIKEVELDIVPSIKVKPL